MNESTVSEQADFYAEIKAAITLDPELLENPTLLNEAWIRLPGEVARMGYKYAEALKLFHSCERRQKAVWAATRERIRTDLSANKSGSRVVLAEVDAQAFQDPAWQEAAEREENAEKEMEVRRYIMEALRAKRDALTNLSAAMRQERSTSMEPGFRDSKPRF